MLIDAYLPSFSCSIEYFLFIERTQTSADRSRAMSPASKQGNTMNTTAPRTAKTEAGNIVALPASFPSYSEREAIRAMIQKDQSNATIGLIHTMEKIMRGSYVGDLFNAENVWSEAEAAFADHHGITWMDATAATVDTDCIGDAPEDADHNGSTATAPALQMPTIEGMDLDFLTSIIKNNPFQMVSRQSYNAAFSGACALRRAGVEWKVYSSRMLAAGHQKGYVAHLVTRVYTMPAAQLVAIYRA